jgi:hypothetical protein
MMNMAFGGIPGAGTTGIEVQARPPFIRSGRPDCRLMKTSPGDYVGHGCPRRCAYRNLISNGVVSLRYMAWFEDVEGALQLLGMNEVSGKMWVAAVELPSDLFDYHLGVPLGKEHTDLMRKSSGETKR